MNVILICLDTFRADCVAALERNDFIQTPNIDRLVREGVLFENAFGEGQPTIQFRRSLCTGMQSFPFDGAYDNKGYWPMSPGWHKIPPEQSTIAEVLLENGYMTGLVSDTFHLFKPTTNFTRGMASWDFIRGQEDDNYRTGPLSAIDLSKYCEPGKEPPPMLVQYLLNNQDRKSEMDFSSAKVFTSAIRYLEDNRENQPFFLWIDSFDPHEAWDPPRKFADIYDPDWDEEWEPISYLSDYTNEKINKRHKALYYGECTFVDKQIGRLLDALDENGLTDDTLIIVTSDHGTEIMDHGSFGKNVHKNRYRFNSEIVCIMRFPEKVNAGKRVKGFVLNHDFFPTILSLLGVKHESVDGLDFTPLITGEKGSIRNFAITGWSGYRSPTRASVRSHECAYSCDYQRENLDEHLFDLKADPHEMRNAAHEHPDAVEEYRSRLEDYLGEKLPGKPYPELEKVTAPVDIWLEKTSRTQNSKRTKK